MTTHFTGCTHFGHANVIKYCKRPFVNKEQMDAIMVAAWNDHVAKNDRVYHLGDLAFYKTQAELDDLVARLNGLIFLVPGNHDNLKKLKQTKVNILPPQVTIIEQGQTIVLNHYPMRHWEKSHYGSWHLFSHVHGVLGMQTNASMDVGFDAVGYAPVSFDYVAHRIHAQEKTNPNWCKNLPGAPESWNVNPWSA